MNGDYDVSLLQAGEVIVDGNNPIILFSSCQSHSNSGFAKYNGGYKLYNLWVKLLRQNGLQAYVVTYDGSYVPWLIEHQPHVSIETVKKWIAAGLNIKFVTGWLDSKAYLDLCSSFYFFDAELAYTSTTHRALLDTLLSSRKIVRIATHSRVQQAWYLMNYGIEVDFIPEWSDTTFWRPNKNPRIGKIVGYMQESPGTDREIRLIELLCNKSRCGLAFRKIQGNEQQVLEQMNECDIFLGMNQGKHPLWGEGCPRSQQEAMHAGCVVVAYDVRGNREYLHDGFNGLLIPRGRPDLMAEAVMALAEAEERKEALRRQSLNFAANAWAQHGRYQHVARFLDLPLHSPSLMAQQKGLVTKEEVEQRLKAPVFLGVDEVPVLARYASGCKGTMLEIGSAFGASASVFLTNSSSPASLYSIDPFVKDSMGEFTSSATLCRDRVWAVLKETGRDEAFTRWTLITDYSHEVSKRWNGGPLSLLFIDGDHRYPAVSGDFRDWAPRVEPGGHILLHDSRREPHDREDQFARGWQGPTQLAAELREHDCVELVEEAFSLTVWRKRDVPCQLCKEGRR